MKWATPAKVIPAILAVLAAGMLTLWLLPHSSESLQLRIPGTDAAPTGETGGGNPVRAGKVIRGNGQPTPLPGSWPQFRGPNRDGIARAPTSLSPLGGEGQGAGARSEFTVMPLSRDWKTSPPRELWSLDLGEGYAGAAVSAGRVFIFDYDRDAKQSALRCLSLADGKEIWGYTYPLTIKRNHGMTRTVPAVASNLVVALDSKCNVFALDAVTGELKWSVSLVRDFGATVPEWYAGQCPLVDGDKVILAPGGKNALLLALDLATGKPLWQTPNPHDWKMTHSSIMPMDFAGRRLYVYCANKGVVGVDANDGKLLWETTEWKIAIATVPSPLPLPDGRIFLTGGYGAGSLMLKLETNDSTDSLSPLGGEGQGEGALRFSVRPLFKLAPEIFGATQHTPIFKDGHLYGARADNRFVCLDLDGKVIWASGPDATFGLGSFLMADTVMFALNDAGLLRLLNASPEEFQLLGQLQILHGRESWAPLALAGNRLLARDLTRLVCLQVGPD
ncbi:MAG TPA: PQQ-binding-like beta-propeller repeat protein [Verrucomicrobiae bacterium]|nr:PQQ-binding-like beta-propeller repeat protein [Verrucomicrobiae bacterium]